MPGTDASSVGYWAGQEQYSMRELLGFAVEAERAGFKTIMTSDHFHPWFNTNGYGNYTWVWMAVAAEKTKRMQFVTGVTCPIFRYPPAIVAQAFASLDNLYPGRVGLGLGTGEAMNEVPNGFDWGTQPERLERTKEAIEIIQGLWKGKGEFLSYQGKFHNIRNARMYTPPTGPIPLYMAATGRNSTRVVARYCDGLITFADEGFAERLSVFRSEASDCGRDADSLEDITEYKLSYAEDYESALASTRRWKSTLLRGVLMSEIYDPRELEARADAEVSDEELARSWDIMTSIDDAAAAIEDLFKAGMTKVYVHSSSPDEMAFLKAFSSSVLPHFQGSGER